MNRENLKISLEVVDCFLFRVHVCALHFLLYFTVFFTKDVKVSNISDRLGQQCDWKDFSGVSLTNNIICKVYARYVIIAPSTSDTFGLCEVEIHGKFKMDYKHFLF